MSLFNFFSCWIPSWLRKEEHAFLLDMPDVVTNEILKKLDFATIRKLQKVCHAFRDYIDCVKPDSHLKSIDLEVVEELIFVSFSTPSQSNLEIQISFEDVVDFLWAALKYQKSLLDELRFVSFVGYAVELKNAETFIKLFDRLMKVLKSRDRLLQVGALPISVHGQDQLTELLSHVDLKVLKSLEVFRLLEIEELSDNGDDNSEFVLDLDILKECENLENLHVKGFSISSPFRMITHIPILTVNMQTIYCEDLLLLKHTMENLNINAFSEIKYGQFPDKARFLEDIGLVDDNSKLVHVFPSKLTLTYYPASKFESFEECATRSVTISIV
ncbi:hypothetical protein GCK72_021429 [Caenorhabditis remanei]|uniref:F-box domain-containing protein n=1 Tax=Caenorhabditis remanei TaxID=31234 RepID=A0A6A5GJF5_CAERE|nr:hypothetical protein GCK72_021429 [Caenorhabditis remanei]KAF1754864.1 hypothetical protein GCK72_021429 [Caenorhabditis remanei]